MSRPGRASTSRPSTRSAWSRRPDPTERARLAGDVPRGRRGPVEVYVDMTTPPVWDGAGAARGRPRPRRGARHHRPGVGRRRGRVRRAPGRASAIPTRSSAAPCAPATGCRPRSRGRPRAVRRQRAGLAGAARGAADRHCSTARRPPGPALRAAAVAAGPHRATGRPGAARRAGSRASAASRLSGWATYSPRITPGGQRDRDRGGGDHRQQPVRGRVCRPRRAATGPR